MFYRLPASLLGGADLGQGSRSAEDRWADLYAALERLHGTTVIALDRANAHCDALLLALERSQVQVQELVALIGQFTPAASEVAGVAHRVGARVAD